MSRIRIVRKDDLGGIVVLIEKYYEYDRHDFDRKNARRAMRRLLVDPALGRVFLAADKNSAIGYLALAFGYSLEYHGRDAFVDEFFILEKYRGNGLGGKMLAYAEKAAKRLRVRPSILKSRDTMNPSCTFAVVKDSKTTTGTWRPSMCKVF